MKFIRSERPRGLKSMEALGTEPQAPGFDIRRDVSLQNWEFIRKEVANRLALGSVYGLTTDAKALVLLGEDNKSGLNMSEIKRVGFADAYDRFSRVAPSVSDSTGWKQLADILIEVAIINPDWDHELSPQVIEQLWFQFEGNVSWRSLSWVLSIALALYLHFPEKRKYILEKLNQAGLKQELLECFQRPSRGFLMEAGMAYGLLFPGTFKSELTLGLWRRVGRELSQPEHEMPLPDVTCFYMLSADDVKIDDEGVISVIHQTRPVGQPARRLPERSLE